MSACVIRLNQGKRVSPKRGPNKDAYFVFADSQIPVGTKGTDLLGKHIINIFGLQPEVFHFCPIGIKKCPKLPRIRPPMTNLNPNESLKALNITLPDAPKPVASYVPARQSGKLVYISGQIPMADGSLLATGAVPSKVSVEQAIECARQCTLNCLANLQTHLGDLARVTKIVRVGVFVASDPGFGSQPQIANGCSDLLVEIFGESIGQHARAAVGVSALPLNVPVEIEFLFEVQ